MVKKITTSFILILILTASFTSIVTANIQRNEAEMIEINQSIELEQQFLDIYEEELLKTPDIDKIKDMFEGWTIIGPAYVESEGKGLHISLFKPKLTINAATPTMFRIIRWWNICKYYNPLAKTTIEPLLTGQKINLHGPHAIIAGTLIYPQGPLGGIIGNILPKLEENFEIIDKLFGNAIWDWGGDFINGKPLLEYLYNNSEVFQKLWNFILIPRLIMTLIYMLTIPIPLYGFYQTLDFSGISPFVLYKEL